MIKRITLSVFFVFLSLFVSGQVTEHYELPGTGPHLIRFSEAPSLQNLATVFNSYYPIKDGYSWKKVNSISDELGFTHHRYQFYFNQAEVLGSVLIVHCKDGKIEEINGRFYEVSKAKANINSENAIKLVLNYVNAAKYMWQDSMEEEEIKEIDNNKEATYYPKPVLKYVPNELNFENNQTLTYAIEVYAQEPLSYKEYYLDAKNGNLIAEQNLLMDVHDTGTAETAYSGTRTIFTDSVSATSFRLRDSIRDVRTFDMNTGTNYGAAVDFFDTDNDWDNVNAQEDEVATDAHWGAEMTYDYFLDEHNRNSYDDNGARILSYVHFRANYDNAFWDGRRMTYGDGNSFKPLTALDVCGHEIAHAVTTNTAGLIYRYESGALNESFSDIFGNTVEAWARPTQWDWKIGEDITTSGNGLRNMANPNLRNHPKYYKGFRWRTGAADNGGVHSNSGVQNYWYYLLVEGDTGTNENSDAYEIEALGFTDAAKIAYRNLSVYLTPSSNYAEARIYAIKSAADLFGQCTKEVINTTNAWFVCGVGDRYDSALVEVDFIADTLICSTSQIVNFSNRSTNFKQCIWEFGDGNTSILTDPTHQYGAYNSYDIKLKAESCFQNNWDSLTKTAYVKVDSSQDICKAIFMPAQGTDSLSFCDGFIYDEGGLDDYAQNEVTFLKVTSPGADSITLTFEDLDYEEDYDTLTLYAGAPIAGNEIGKYFNSVLPNGGLPFVVQGDYISLRQWSDPFVVGRGFKLKFKAHKQPLELVANRDTTLCVGNSLDLAALGSGGFSGDYNFLWNNDTAIASYTVYPSKDSSYTVTLFDACTKEIRYDTVEVVMRDSLQIQGPNDTLICNSASIDANISALGGLAPYTFVWDNGLGSGNTKNLSPSVNTTYQVYVTDNCTANNDTANFSISLRPALGLTISASDTILCDNQSVKLRATQSGGDTLNRQLTWTVNGSNLDSISFIPASTGWYSVTLSDNCSPDLMDSVYLRILEPLALTKHNDTLICQGSDVDLWVNVQGGKPADYNYSWDQGIPNQDNFTATVNENITYHLTLSDGCSPNILDSISVTVLPSLSLAKPLDSVICFGQSYTVNLMGSGGLLSGHNYQWDNGLSSGQSKVLQLTLSTSYQVYLEDGCTEKNDTQNFTLTVRDPISITNLLVAPSVICEGQTSQLSFLIQGGKLPVSASLDGVSISSPYQISPSLSKNSYWIKAEDGCSNPDSIQVNVAVNPLPSFDISANKTDLCIGDSVVFTHNFGGVNTYQWYINNAASTTNSTFTWVPQTIGAFTASLAITDANLCLGSDTLLNAINVVEAPIAKFSFTPLEPNIENSLVSFNNLSQFATQFEWSFGDGSPSTSASNPTYVYADTGSYSVTLRAVNSIGCEATTVQNVRIRPVYKLFMPTAFSPNGDGINDNFAIKGSGIVQAKMQVYNRWGEKLKELEGFNLSWDGKLGNGEIIPTGIYIYYIELIDINGVKHIVKDKILVLE